MNPFIIVFLLGIANSLQPGMIMAFNISVLNSVENYIISKLDQKFANLSLPDYHKKNPFFDVNLTNNSFYMYPINPKQVSIYYKNSSNKLQANAKGIDGNVSINIDY